LTRMERKVNNCAVLGSYDVMKIIDIRIVDGATFWCCMRIADTLGQLLWVIWMLEGVILHWHCHR
jgi:hypothetical protein